MVKKWLNLLIINKLVRRAWNRQEVQTK
jgi:hypothetical protein